MATNQADFIAKLKHHADRYITRNETVESLKFLRNARREVACAWLAANEAKLPDLLAGPLGWAHATIMSCMLKNEALSIDERRFAEELARSLSGDFGEGGSYKHLLATMLYLDGYETRINFSHYQVPHWLVKYVMVFVFFRTKVIMNSEDMERFNALIYNALKAMHNTLFHAGKSESQKGQFLQSVVIPYFRLTSLTNAYFSDRSLKEECVLRAEMLEEVARTAGSNLSYTFPSRLSGRKIRLGILRPHFNPSTETYATLPIFEHLDHNRFEVILYTESVGGGSLERYCASRADRLTDLSRVGTNPQSHIRADDLDILFFGSNLSALPRPNMLALYRLARIQIASFCEPATSGVRNMDYYLAGELALPLDGSSLFYSERLLRMQGSGICFSYGDSKQTVVPTRRSQLGISEDSVVYISGTNMVKFGVSLCVSWAEILAAVPGSVILMYPFNPHWLKHYPVETFASELQSIFAQHGVEKERVILLDPRDEFAEIRGILNLADIYLDSYPYSGATSFADALQSWLPAVALEGRYLRFRQAAAILREMGLHELVAATEKDYRQVSINLGLDYARRENFRNRIRESLDQKNNFLDSRGYCEKVAELFSTLIHENT
jgi:predicted O-linked N-acetylglucosamine transferase (SPINDLY family)